VTSRVLGVIRNRAHLADGGRAPRPGDVGPVSARGTCVVEHTRALRRSAGAAAEQGWRLRLRGPRTPAPTSTRKESSARRIPRRRALSSQHLTLLCVRLRLTIAFSSTVPPTVGSGGSASARARSPGRTPRKDVQSFFSLSTSHVIAGEAAVPHTPLWGCRQPSQLLSVEQSHPVR
jgi:hypothetical protein